MDINLMREIVTVASFAAFVALLAWIYWPKNKGHFEEVGRLPADEEGR